MSKSNPTLKEWEQLYKQAIAFKELAPWRWMYDSEVFGVKDESYKDIGYCCVLGKRMEVFALVVYLGTEGLNAHQKMQSGELGNDTMEVLHIQKSLMASFKNHQLLEEKDLRIIKELRLKFRGPKKWPMFRSYEPGYAPWHLTKKEAKFLTLVLEQTIEVAKRLRENDDLLIPPRKGLYLVRVSRKQGKKIEWKDEWLAPTPIDQSMPESDEQETPAVPLNEIRLHKIQQNTSRKNQSWEIDCFYASSAVTDKERPYFPILYLCVDSESSFILDFNLFKDREEITKAGFNDTTTGLL